MSLHLIVILIIHLALYSSAEEVPPLDDRPDNRIINGFTPNQFNNPHVALLFVHFTEGTAACSGTLISSKWVITAGHCAQGAVTIEVHLGVFNRTKPSPQKIIVSANNIFLHPAFVKNDTVTLNDIALLRLSPRANTLLRSIRPISYVCSRAGNFVGRIGRACGWGITNNTASNITTLLQCADFPVITNSECTQTWGGKVSFTNICTRTVNGRTTCHGDSGGPLFLRDGILRRQKLIGTISFGSDPCGGTSPDVFTRISSFSTWIRRITGVLCELL